jgi:hypothetical protein
MSVPTDRRAGGTKIKRALGVQAALEWAFRWNRRSWNCRRQRT